MSVLALDNLTSEKLAVRVAASDADPSTAAVEFAVVARNAEPVEDDWSAGTWSSVNDYVADAVTPRIGTGGTFEVTAGATYSLWIRITPANEVIVRRVGDLEIR